MQIRPLTLEDAKPLVDLQSTNREFLAPWEPTREAEFFRLPGQRVRSRSYLATTSRG